MNSHNKVITKGIKNHLREFMLSPVVGKLGLKIVTREEIFDLENIDKYQIFPLASEETIVISKPCNSSDAIRLIERSTGTFTLKKPFVLELEDAELMGAPTAGFDENKHLLLETVTGTRTSSLNRLPIKTLLLKNLPSWGSPQLDTVCSLVNWFPKNYFHWITDSLLRIEGFEYYQNKTGRKPILIIEKNAPKWKIESLRLLGYDPDACIQWNESRVRVKRLVVSSFRREHNLISPAGCQWLRQRILSNLPAASSKNLSCSPRIYISRPKTAGRHVINEDEVLAALAPLGFVSYTMEELSFEDEVRLFSQAEIVVATHGAGLTNMIFAPQNLTVIELFSSSADSFGSACFFVLAQALGFRYGCLGANPNPKKTREKYNGIMVNAARLLELVKEMLSQASDHQLVSVGEILPLSSDRQLVSVEEALSQVSDRQLVSVEEALSLAGDQSANTSVLNSDDLVELQDDR